MRPHLSPFFPTMKCDPTSYDHYASPNAVSAALWAARNRHGMTLCPAGEIPAAGQGLDGHSTVPCLCWLDEGIVLHVAWFTVFKHAC